MSMHFFCSWLYWPCTAQLIGIGFFGLFYSANSIHYNMSVQCTSFSAFSNCQCQLPATGVPVTQQHSDQMKQMLQAYIKDRTNQNWKFYVFSQIATPLFDTFNGIVSTASVEELYRTTQLWLDQHCSLPALRPGKCFIDIEYGIGN